MFLGLRVKKKASGISFAVCERMVRSFVKTLFIKSYLTVKSRLVLKSWFLFRA